MRRLLMAAMLGGVSLMPMSVTAEPFRFVAMGDLPYFLPDDMVRFEGLIAKINRRKPAFTVHVGDIKSGSSPCTDRVFQVIHDRFMTFQAPLFYTPGDNEWTDCHRRKAGRMDPIERLQRLRSMFFDKPVSLGQQAMPYARQSDVNTQQPEERQMVENAIWAYGDVLFATLHIVGSNNNLGRDSANDAEFEARDRANLVWLKTAFNEAKTLSAKAVVLIFHANPRFSKQKSRTSRKSGFRTFLTLLPDLVTDFQRPVLLVHGDTHQLVIDRPLLDRDDQLVRNATRLEIMGAPDVGAVEVRVDTATDAVFSFTPFYAPVPTPEFSDR